MYAISGSRACAFAVALALGAPFAMAAETGGGASPAPSTPASPPDIAKGEDKAKVCVACHGEQGVSQQPNYPHLHGQHQTYLLRQLRTFRDGGDRRDPIMTPMLENMTDQDLANIAAYYGSFDGVLGSHIEDSGSSAPVMPTPATPAKDLATEAQPASASVEAQAAAPAAPPTDAGLVGDAAAGQAKAATCAACHGTDGRGTTPLFPNLNGQKAEYLARQLRAFRDGVRQDPNMGPMVSALTDQDIADLAAFYADLK